MADKVTNSLALLLILLAMAVTACRESAASSTVTAITPSPAAYPIAGITATPVITEAYPAATAAAQPTIQPTNQPTIQPTNQLTSGSTPNEQLFLPFVVEAYPAPAGGLATTPTPVPSPTATPLPTPTPLPTVDFAAVAAQLRTTGQALAPIKIGFHTGIGGNSAGLEEWMRQLDAAGVPFFLKSVDNAQPILFAQQLMQQSGVPHILVYRRSSADDYNYDVPNYNLPPAEAAREHWQRHLTVFPPELDRNLVWLETINEVDKNQAEWLGQFALATAEMALADGYRWAAFGWASGEPEPEHWQTPSMLAFLRLAANNPDRLAIALHEYSYEMEDIGDLYPYKVGRFQELFRIADQHGIPRPTVLITEWGWTYEDVPEPEQALRDIKWAAQLYAPYPEVKGVAIWYLGGGFARIADQAQRLIRPLLDYSLRHYFTVPLPPPQAPINPELYRP
ncbi:MAG TPA: hypothetical protein VF177_21160 [Anaerolineae bacterium]